MISRLESHAPALAARLREAPADKRRAALTLACTWAVEESKLAGDAVDAALDALRTAVDAVVAASLQEQIAQLEGELDEKYFELDEQGDRASALGWFSRARAASALAFALSSDEGAVESAIYEALFALSDGSALEARLDRALV